MKKQALSVIAFIMVGLMLVSCGGAGFTADSQITAISREEGSGTRGAFVELFGIEEKNSAGEKVDRTASTCDITQSTGVMLTSVAGNPAAIGYVSLGSLNESVKALKISGVEASIENVKNGSYEITRPFNLVTKGDISDAARDFTDYILSSDGASVIEEMGYVAVSDGDYTASGMKGKITVVGSSSVTPVMEKLREAYIDINPDVKIEITQSDSSNGISSAQEGVCDIGMASRALKENEDGLDTIQIATDAVAVIVSCDNPLETLDPEQVCSIFIGEETNWSAFVGK